MPKLIVVERDYAAVAEKWRALGPLVEELGTGVKGAPGSRRPEVEELRAERRSARRRRRRAPVAGARRARRARRSWRSRARPTAASRSRASARWSARTGVPLADLAGERADDRITFADAQVQPRTVITSPEWSGIEARGRRYSPFTINVERDKPWHTLSGRQQLYLDHAWMLELGEGLPAYRPPLDAPRDRSASRAPTPTTAAPS